MPHNNYGFLARWRWNGMVLAAICVSQTAVAHETPDQPHMHADTGSLTHGSVHVADPTIIILVLLAMALLAAGVVLHARSRATDRRDPNGASDPPKNSGRD